MPDYEVEDMKLLAKIQALEIRSHNLLHQVRTPSWTAPECTTADTDGWCVQVQLSVLVFSGHIKPEYVHSFHHSHVIISCSSS